jgi:hypothetical protein
MVDESQDDNGLREKRGRKKRRFERKISDFEKIEVESPLLPSPTHKNLSS